MVSLGWLEYPATRRSFAGALAATAAGCVAGGSLAATIVHTPPCLLVVGEGDWQCVLLLAGRVRVLVLTGQPPQNEPVPITRLLSAMRQRIDVIVATPGGLSTLSGDFARRWRIRRTFVLPDSDAELRSVHTGEHALHLPHGIRLDVRIAAAGEWSAHDEGAPSTAGSMVSISHGPTVVAMAATLDTIARFHPMRATMALAPGGTWPDGGGLGSVPVLAVNGDQVETPDPASADQTGADAASRWLVRIFPADVAVFALSPEGLSLPSWRQRLVAPP